MSMNGIDISNWQKGINLAAVPGDFVIMKVTEGTGYVDNMNRQRLRENVSESITMQMVGMWQEKQIIS